MTMQYRWKSQNIILKLLLLNSLEVLICNYKLPFLANETILTNGFAFQVTEHDPAYPLVHKQLLIVVG